MGPHDASTGTDATETSAFDPEAVDQVETDVLVLGSGIAGCTAALAAAREGNEVTLVTKATRPEETTSWWAQGGIAVSRSSPEKFKRDVLSASDGVADPDAVDTLVENANDAVQDVLIETLDVPFDVETDRDVGDDGNLDYGREAAHSERRIIHVNASTGRHVLTPLLSHLDDHSNIAIHEDTPGLDLLTHEGRVHGAICAFEGEFVPVFAGATVLATGGIGSLYPRSTNPGGTGDGIAMAALAGADVADMEYVQFHPTAYAGDERDTDGTAGTAAFADSEDAPEGDDDPGEREGTFLLSEAVRGEGAILRNGVGERFMPEYHADAELAPRDVVARAVATERDRTGEVRLDVASDTVRDRSLALGGEALDFERDFPDLAAECRRRGVDPSEGIPIAPAEHFLCGGISVDREGKTSLDRLFAVGECSHTGVHGANRLASTSLLEGLVWGLRAGHAASGHGPTPIDVPELADRDPALPAGFYTEKLARLRRVMGRSCGLTRSPDDLRRATAAIRRLKGETDAYARTRSSRALSELRGAVVTGLLVARAAASNPESKGCHHLAADDAGAGGVDDTDGTDGTDASGVATGGKHADD